MNLSRISGHSGVAPGLLIAVVALGACGEGADVPSPGYQPYLEGVEFYEQGGEANLRQAINRFTLATQLDTVFAPAFAGLSRAYSSIGGNYNILSPEETWGRARIAADMALQIDDQLAEAHLAQAMVTSGAAWDWTVSELEYQRTLELDPDNVEALTSYAMFLYGLGRSAEAAPFAERANELAPGSADPFLMYGVTGDAAAQIQAANAAIDADPTNPGNYWSAALIHTWEGEYDEAAQRLQQQIPLMEGDVVDEVALLGFVYGRMGREEEARGMLERLDEVAAEGRYVSPVLKAWVYSGLGDADEAIAWLRTGYEARAHRSGLGMNTFSKVYDPIREHADFKALLEEMGL